MVRALKFCWFEVFEIIDDLKSHSEEEVYQLVTKRLEGLLLRKRLGDEDILSLMEVIILKEDESCYEECMNKLPFINEVLNLLNRTCLLKKFRFGFNVGNI
jgi:hypothetical protein